MLAKKFILALAFIWSGGTVYADDEPDESDDHPKLFQGFFKNIADSFTGSNAYLHLAGAASTPLLIRTGVDANIYSTFRNRPNLESFPGAIIGSGAAALVSGIYLYSRDEKREVGAAFAIAQAALITGVYIKTLKMITGRAHPTNTSPLTAQEQSEQFEFGSMQVKNGYGWPSGHVSHTVAVMSALTNYYPEKQWLKWLGLGLSSYMLYTVVSFDHGQMHWFSDGVAGAFMGYSIGSTVGKNFRSQIDGPQIQIPDSTWTPVFGPNYIGLRILN